MRVLPDAATARVMRHHLHGTVMPEKVVQRMAQAADPQQEGIRLAAEKIQRLREIPGVSGVNLMTPGPPELLVETIQAAGLAATNTVTH